MKFKVGDVIKYSIDFTSPGRDYRFYTGTILSIHNDLYRIRLLNERGVRFVNKKRIEKLESPDDIFKELLMK